MNLPRTLFPQWIAVVSTAFALSDDSPPLACVVTMAKERTYNKCEDSVVMGTGAEQWGGLARRLWGKSWVTVVLGELWTYNQYVEASDSTLQLQGHFPALLKCQRGTRAAPSVLTPLCQVFSNSNCDALEFVFVDAKEGKSYGGGQEWWILQQPLFFLTNQTP